MPALLPRSDLLAQRRRPHRRARLRRRRPRLSERALIAARRPCAIAVLLSFGLLAGCGTGPDTGAAGQGVATGEEPTAPASPEAADAFPVTIDHKYGRTEIVADPERVVTVGFNDQDFVLALGVTPVGVRQFQGGIDITDRPWAQDELAGTDLEVVGAEELDFEQIAALRPDLILGLYSGLTQDNYDTLSQIAPTVAQPGEFIDYGVPWREQMLLIGRALGAEGQAEEIIADVEAQFAQARESHAGFDGQTLVLASAATADLYVYGSQDLRVQFFSELGFDTPDQIDELAGESFFAPLSDEQLPLLDHDVLVVYGDRETLESDQFFASLDAAQQGRVIYLDPSGDLANALGFSSPLSLPFALDGFVPQLAAAVDGDLDTAP